MELNFPEFKKIEKVIDGQLIEKFYIDNQEVTESTYYSILEDRMGVFTQPKKIENKKINDKKIENKKIITQTSEDIHEQQEEYINSLLTLIEDNPEESFDILYDELVYHYKLGYLIGQLDLNQTYSKGMKQNYRLLQEKIEDLIEEYGKGNDY